VTKRVKPGIFGNQEIVRGAREPVISKRPPSAPPAVRTCSCRRCPHCTAMINARGGSDSGDRGGEDGDA
jgi:hypothetical protein